MDEMIVYILGTIIFVIILMLIRQRLELSIAKHPSLGGHPRMARRLAALIPFYSYDETTAFGLDNPPDEIIAKRKTAFDHLSEQYRHKFVKNQELTIQAAEKISDLQFTSAYRVPFQFRELVKDTLRSGVFVNSTSGVSVTDIDGNRFYDLAGSYGVNLFGYDFYKQCINAGADIAKETGPILGSYHPVVVDNAQRLCQISGLDEVSFHMSGTEAVMQAVRLARYNTGKKRLVRFCGAYHGWWGDVQPGIGNPVDTHDTFTLKEMDASTLRVLRKRSDIACVLVNPLQAMHINSGAPADSALVDSSRKASFQKDTYINWLKQLREVCVDKNIVLIFDEVFTGFRLSPGGAQEYFGIQADMVTYGKTLGGGLPIGVLCGKKELMKRYRDQAPANICFARGTFNSHPYVMGAMNVFLQSLNNPEIQVLYQNLDATWNARAAELSRQLDEKQLPLKVVNLSTIWTVLYTAPGYYNWLFQYYLRNEGLALSWVGTGRFIFSLNYTDQDFSEVTKRFIDAATAMQSDGWWWHSPLLTNKSIRNRITGDLLRHKFSNL